MVEIRDLHIKFHARDREAVGGIDLTLPDGEILGLVGESGSGKTVTAMALSGLLDRNIADCRGEILLDGEDMLRLRGADFRRLQGKKIGVIFQEPMSALDPLQKIGKQVEESLRLHTKMTAAERRAAALEAMEIAELDEVEKVYEKYPFELSGGMLQRVMIAAAIITKPSLLVADEPTTALDVTLQGQILELLKKLNSQYGMSILFISHNLHVVRKLCDRVAVMQLGKIVEAGATEEILKAPEHEYTKELIAAIPTRDKRLRNQ
ncbi:MAG: ABC transporter ATP-binding protein [Oscillospiraceae bacterium]|nr:ABC transporter ATP-binding protein [Oscillospiraceae bacterium]